MPGSFPYQGVLRHPLWLIGLLLATGCAQTRIESSGYAYSAGHACRGCHGADVEKR